MQAFGLSALLLMLLGNFGLLKGVVPGTPRDLASLLEPKAALTLLQVKTDEASLLALLQPSDGIRINAARLEQAVKDLGGDSLQRKRGQEVLRKAGADALPYLEKAGANPDPEVSSTARDLRREIERQRAAGGNTAYVTKLLAIRALEQMKAKAALPILEKLATDSSPTLAAAAAEAAASISGKPLAPPAATAALKDVMARLPPNLGFVAVADLARGRQNYTLAEVLAKLPEVVKDKPEMQGILPMLAMVTPQASQMLVQALGITGNIRLDALVVGLTDDVATGPDHEAGAALVICKGLYEPALVTAALKTHGGCQERQEAGLTIFYRQNMACCALDAKTFVLAMSEAKDGSQILPALAAWKAKAGTKLLPASQDAFDLVLQQKSYAAVGGALGRAQRELVLKATAAALANAQNRPAQPGLQELEPAMLKVLNQFAGAEAYLAQVTPDLRTLLEVTFADAAGATAFRELAVTTEQRLRDMLTAELAKLKDQPEAAKLVGGLDLKTPFVKLAVQQNKVTVTLENVLAPLVGMPVMMMLGRQMPIAPPVEFQPPRQ